MSLKFSFVSSSISMHTSNEAITQLLRLTAFIFMTPMIRMHLITAASFHGPYKYLLYRLDVWHTLQTFLCIMHGTSIAPTDVSIFHTVHSNS